MYSKILLIIDCNESNGILFTHCWVKLKMVDNSCGLAIFLSHRGHNSFDARHSRNRKKKSSLLSWNLYVIYSKLWEANGYHYPFILWETDCDMYMYMSFVCIDSHLQITLLQSIYRFANKANQSITHTQSGGQAMGEREREKPIQQEQIFCIQSHTLTLCMCVLRAFDSYWCILCVCPACRMSIRCIDIVYVQSIHFGLH